MLLGVIADDFTGAGDVANTLAREGMATRLFVRLEDPAHGCEAGVVALKSRSIPAPEAVSQALGACEWLLAQGARQILFKYCSTFDSTPAGNIGPVAEALADRLGAGGVVVCPAFPANGRTLYQGHLFVYDKLLSDTAMASHPLTPMTDPDIRRWLARQSRAAPGFVPLKVVRAGGEAIRQALAGGPTLAVVDAVAEEDLRAIGLSVAGAPLVTGGSGIALGLPENFRAQGLLRGDREGCFKPQTGPALALAGSCSPATLAQVERYRTRHPTLQLDIAALMGGADVLGQALAFHAQHRDAAPLITSSVPPAAVAALQGAFGREATAAAAEALFGALASAAVERGVRRLVVAGGETSGAVVEALGMAALDVGPEIDPGAPALSGRTAQGRPVALALKSGNFGGVDFLEKARDRLG